MSLSALGSWAASVRSIALPGAPAQLLQLPVGERENAIQAFRDGAGQCREVDRLLLAALMDAPARGASTDASLDLRAWSCVVARGPVPGPSAAAGPLTGFGGLFGVRVESEASATTSIETLTEQELACLHAFSWLEGLTARVREAAEWLIEHVQPDNATMRPWSAQVFAAMGMEGNTDAKMYAQTLVHNALVAGGGKPEPLSACILLDAAEWGVRVSGGIPLRPRHVR